MPTRTKCVWQASDEGVHYGKERDAGGKPGIYLCTYIQLWRRDFDFTSLL
jgi:hypothetical protein